MWYEATVLNLGSHLAKDKVESITHSEHQENSEQMRDLIISTIQILEENMTNFYLNLE